MISVRYLVVVSIVVCCFIGGLVLVIVGNSMIVVCGVFGGWVSSLVSVVLLL